MTPLTFEEAAVVWDILVDYAGATRSEDSWMRASFVHYVTEPSSLYEFRFVGNLGSGGKFYLEHSGWSVSHSKEDSTDIRKLIERRTNDALDGARRAFKQIKESTPF